MTIILYLLTISLALGACGLVFFLWSLRSGQYDDMEGAANRILFDDDGTRDDGTGDDGTGDDGTGDDGIGPPPRKPTP